GVHISTSDLQVSGRGSPIQAQASKDHCPAILKSRETQQSSQRKLCDCQYLLAPCCSSRPDKTLSWVSSSTFRVARRARYRPSAGDRPHCPCCLVTLSSRPTRRIAVIKPDFGQVSQPTELLTKLYCFGETRVATLSLLTFTTPSSWSCGVITAKFSGHA